MREWNSSYDIYNRQPDHSAEEYSNIKRLRLVTPGCGSPGPGPDFYRERRNSILFRAEHVSLHNTSCKICEKGSEWV